MLTEPVLTLRQMIVVTRSSSGSLLRAPGLFDRGEHCAGGRTVSLQALPLDVQDERFGSRYSPDLAVFLLGDQLAEPGAIWCEPPASLGRPLGLQDCPFLRRG